MHSRQEKLDAFGRFLDVLDTLREKCPWDRKQTNESLRPNTIEEVYELCDALMADDVRNINDFGYIYSIFYPVATARTLVHQLTSPNSLSNSLTDHIIFHRSLLHSMILRYSRTFSVSHLFLSKDCLLSSLSIYPAIFFHFSPKCTPS